MSKRKKNGSPAAARKTGPEKVRLIRDAERLIKYKKLTVKQAAERLDVPYYWIYYHVGSARELRAA